MSERKLDPSQLDAVQIEPSTRQVVIAGPGSGKTEVVSRLIEHLVEEEGAGTSDGILVISFSNAAVFAADARLRTNGVGPVTVQTMDSLAGEIIQDLWDDDATGLGYDRRIELATRLLCDEHWDRLDDLEHLVVDEVQDIVGVRADFLVQVLRQLPEEAGFSLLGDPAQGIYDWQLRADRPLSKTTTPELLAQVRAMDDVAVKHLTGQYRAVSRDARKVLELRDSALRPDRASRLDDFFADLVSVATIADVIQHAQTWSGTTAFLTANNGQALLTAGAIADAGARVEVRRNAHQRVLASWIARLLADHATPGITRDELEERASLDRGSPDPAMVWRAVRSVAGSRGRETDIPSLARGLRRPRPIVPDLIEPMDARFIVSTVHRAKGLEFDNVVSLDFPAKPWLHHNLGDDGGEAGRTLFVALSRARQVLVRANGPDDRSLRSLTPRGEHARRWYLGGPAKYMTHGFELRVDDLDRTEPPGTDRAATQKHIAESVRPGDPLRMTLDHSRSTLRLPVWNLLHGEHVVGRTSTAFGELFARRTGTLEKKRRGWPRLTGARVESVATVSGDPQPGETGRFGLWLSPVCADMLRIDWSGEGDD